MGVKPTHFSFSCKDRRCPQANVPSRRVERGQPVLGNWVGVLNDGKVSPALSACEAHRDPTRPVFHFPMQRGVRGAWAHPRHQLELGFRPGLTPLS